MALQSFAKGDWVRGRSREGELVRGYVVDVNASQQIMKVHIMESDNDVIIGKSIWILYKYAEKLPIINPSSEAELYALIDLALVTKDEQWFIELTEQLHKTQKKTSHKEKPGFLVNGKRLENIESKQKEWTNE